MMAMKRHKGFMLIEILIAFSVLIVVLALAFDVMKITFKLQAIGLARSNLAQNQTVIMQRISQQAAIYSRTAAIQSGESDKLVLNDVAGNRIVSFYKATEAGGTDTMYMSTQIPPNSAVGNQLSDPYNVEVVRFKVYKLSSTKLKMILYMKDKASGVESELVELVTMINGEVL